MYIYKKLNVEDIDIVMKMNKDFRSGFSDHEATTEFLKDQNNWIYVCILDERVISFVYGYVLPRLDGPGKMMYVHEVGVLESLQGKGLGNELMLALKDEVFDENINKIFLMAHKSNIPACKLYDRVGGETNDDEEEDVVYFFKK